MHSGCSEERSPEMCDSEDVDGDIETPRKSCSSTSALEATRLRLAAARARSVTFMWSTGGKFQKQGDASQRPKSTMKRPRK